MTKSDKWNNKKLFIENEKVNQEDVERTGTDVSSANSDIEVANEQRNILKIEPKNEVTITIGVDSKEKNSSPDEEVLVDALKSEDSLNIQEKTVEDESILSYSKGKKGERDKKISHLLSEAVADELSTIESSKEEIILATNQSNVKKQVYQETSPVEADLLMNKITSILIYVICFLILIICGLVLYGTLTNRLFTHRERSETTLVVKQMSEISSERMSGLMIEEVVKPTALVPRPKL